ncbi:hypothetical protein AALO_G00249860 [Alosa alosa]|uniref:Uncharacterized protein n=1 Tax=Alosa alosa TaxID=278164 RepID=A0AAV6FXH8_9TELE|nr:hypothetical protein AALO_G00249860 [Alosa alosa]
MQCLHELSMHPRRPRYHPATSDHHQSGTSPAPAGCWLSAAGRGGLRETPATRSSPLSEEDMASNSIFDSFSNYSSSLLRGKAAI